jgi:hypothetical protein
MTNRLLNIDINPNGLKIDILKDARFNVFQIWLIIVLFGGHVMCIIFIFNSIRNDGIIGIKILFVVIGMYLLSKIHKNLRDFLIFFHGKEEIWIDKNSINYHGKLGLLKKKVRFKLDEIKYLEFTSADTSKYSKYANTFMNIKYGTITLGKSKRRSLTIGQSLCKTDLELLFDRLKNKISLYKN